MTEKELLAARQRIVQKLTQARLEKGLSQEQLAKRIGTQRSNICRIEKGTQNLSLDLMLKIAEALDKDVSVMLEERSSTDVCKEVMGAKQKAQLRRMVDFKFTRHPSLNLPEERLTAIEKQLGERTRELLSIPVQRSAKRKNEPER